MERKVPEEATSISVVISDTPGTKSAILESALEQSNFWEYLEQACQESRSSKKDFRILLKPDMEFFDVGAPTGTDPQLIEHLIDLLFSRGYESVVIADGLSSSDLWLENRSVMILAELAGYRYVTDQGHKYEIVNLSEDAVALDFPPGTVLQGSTLSEVWINAQFRISVAKNKTDEENRYALGVQNLIGILPLRDKDYHYNSRLSAGEVCVDLLNHTPIHFAIIDALVSNHGSIGSRVMKPLATGTLIASRDLLLADWVGALKMGLDPYVSRLNAFALRSIGLPKRYQIIGNLEPYADWRNVPLLLAKAVRKRNESPIINRMTKPWLQEVNTEIFPFKHLFDEQVNALMTKYLSDVDEHPLAYVATLALNMMLGEFNNSLEAWQTVYDKDKLYRQQVALNIDLDSYSFSDYEEVVDYMLPLATIAKHIRPDTYGLRWRYIDESVLFEFERLLPIDYDSFIEKVDICLAVQMMYDNTGGAYVPVHRDEFGRVIHQAERNIYLPQPNWMMLFGGKTIDVEKLETIKYDLHQQQIFWRTVNSPNQSADFDDGSVTFARHQGGTLITIVARQKFALPLVWQAVNLDYVPQLKDAIVSNTYTMFFTRTMANYEAAFEGRSPLIGRQRDMHFGEEEEEIVRRVAQPLTEAFKLMSMFVPQAQTTENGTMDELGYTHFEALNDSSDQLPKLYSEIFRDLLQAFIKDLTMFSNSPNGRFK